MRGRELIFGSAAAILIVGYGALGTRVLPLLLASTSAVATPGQAGDAGVDPGRAPGPHRLHTWR